jgi:serine/threonine protein kinase
MTDQRIEQYELLERIGAGAASSIYRARDTDSGLIVAIKDVVVSDPEKNKYLRHMRNEYDVLTELWAAEDDSNATPGFVKVYDLITSGWLRRQKRSSLVMEYLEGKDLRQEKRYPLGQLMDIFRQVAQALSTIHSRGFVHADLKPENIIVGAHGRVTLVDFGLSCRNGSKASRIRGTREYIAPEQLGNGIITSLTDIYNFGATMYYLLTDTHVPALMPAVGQDEIFISDEKMKPRDVREIKPFIPDELADMVMDCCQLDARRRVSSASRMVATLTKVSQSFANSP